MSWLKILLPWPYLQPDFYYARVSDQGLLGGRNSSVPDLLRDKADS